MHVNVSLSKLVPSRLNPRRVKPEREAHHRLVASIRSFGLLEPLVVRPAGEDEAYQVVAGNRRLSALRQIHGKEDVKIPCQVRKVDDPTAEAMGLAENFAREAMHPLDEAMSFASLASVEGKGVDAIAAEFGVRPGYVRQRMKLAGLSNVVKASYRKGEIDTATAEAFASVPEDRQAEVWRELNGHPRHAEQVRNVIAAAWIDSAHALFDLSTIPESAVSQDLFHERTLVERAVFMDAQMKALEREREKLVEDGWAEVVVARHEDIRDRLLSMDFPPRELNEKSRRRLAKLRAVQEKLEAKLETIEDADEAAMEAIGVKFDALEAKEREIVDSAPERYAEATKAVGSVFLLLAPDGRVAVERRVPRSRRTSGHAGGGHEAMDGNGDGHDPADESTPLTADDLSDRQRAETYHRRALAVRNALLDDAAASKRLLLLILNDKLHSDALSVRREPNATTLYAEHSEGFACEAWDRLKEKRFALDPFKDDHYLRDVDACDRLKELTDSQVNRLIVLLTVEHLMAHPLRRTELVEKLAEELKVDFRRMWRPDASWLSGYRKIQLAHLMSELRGPAYSASHETRKKSELVAALATLFADAAEGRLDDPILAGRVNAWLPTNLRNDSPPGKE